MSPPPIERRRLKQFSIIVIVIGLVGLEKCCVLTLSGIMSAQETPLFASAFGLVFGSGVAGRLLAIEELWVAMGVPGR